MIEFNHISVLADQVTEGLNIKPHGIYVDATLGGGGHAYRVCQKLNGTLIGIDQDANAIAAASVKLSEFKFTDVLLINDNFKNIKKILNDCGVNSVDGITADLGVSSHQLDTAERGFSYHKDAVLDMRMDTKNPITAYNIVNSYSQQRLREIIQKYGEEQFASSIARNIVQQRAKSPIKTTSQLAEIIKESVPPKKRWSSSHPAQKTFQAIRIAVNDELNILSAAVTDFIDVLAPGGRLAVITFHSLEDRIVKQAFTGAAAGCKCPPGFPICVCENRPKIKLITKKPILPTEQEIEYNLRCRSAKLRIIEKL